MPLKRIKKMFAMIVNASKPEKFKKIAFIIDNGKKYEYIIMKMPANCQIIIPDYNNPTYNEQIDTRIIEFCKIGKKNTEESIKDRCRLLNRRRQRQLKKQKDRGAK